ncbi:MAG: efflux RND transporter periplasmic adaptor subunit [Thermoanaerobaculia bacterium]
MAKRMIVMLAVVGAVIALLGFFKYKQIQTAIAEGSSFQPPPEAVTTVIAEESSWDASLSAIGTVKAVQGVVVSADLPGIVEKIAFESGKRVSKGDVLVVLDARQERAQLAAAESQLELARLQLDRFSGLREKGVTSQSEYDSALAAHQQAEARVGEIRATIDRKTIRAPFSGLLGIRQVNVGQYLSPGDPVVPLQSLDPIYVDFALPQQQVGRIDAGTRVEATTEEGGEIDAVGTITAVDSVIDPATRNVQVQATFANQAGKLRPGMFVQTRIALAEASTVIALPASSISYAPYGNSVYVVEEKEGEDGETHKSVRQQFVQLGSSRGDQVAVVSGLEPGAEIVTSGVFKLRNGASVVVNNEVQPGNDPNPTPENS